MKSIFKRVLAFSLILLSLLALLSSCSGSSKPSGEYGTDKYTLVFKGDKITVSWKGLTQEYEMTGTFTMGEKDDGKRTITFKMDKVEGESILGDIGYGAAKLLFDGTKSYNAGKDDNGSYIEIAGTKYYKK